jgi:isochorismate hydrolase
VGTYKSAVEPFIRDDMSPAAREADSRWIGELWQNYLNTVAANRQIPAQQVFPGAQGLLEGLTKTGGDTAKYALENKLVDALASSAEIDELIIMGLATDYCVKFTVLDALQLGYKVNVITDGCRGVNIQPQDSAHAFMEMSAAGATLYTLADWEETQE